MARLHAASCVGAMYFVPPVPGTEMLLDWVSTEYMAQLDEGKPPGQDRTDLRLVVPASSTTD